jgi:membrane protease YdiL (CAAX protease family)
MRLALKKKKTNRALRINKLDITGSLVIYISAALLLFAVTHWLIPYMAERTGLEPVLCWFIAGGLAVFLPLIITGIIILKSEGYPISRQTFTGRLRFRPIHLGELVWMALALAGVAILSALAMKLVVFFAGEFDPSPPFMRFEPLTRGRYWILLAWFPYWILNILGEEFLWRGVMLPRQEAALGKNAWLFHALGWGIFHIAFGWQLLITLLPLLFILSYLVQRTRNSWMGVILHATLNGPAFIAISLGLL